MSWERLGYTSEGYTPAWVYALVLAAIPFVVTISDFTETGARA